MHADVGGLILLALVIEVALAFVAGQVWRDKGGDYAVGFLAGLFLGILGLILVAILTPQAALTGLAGGRSVGIEPAQRPPAVRTGLAPREPGSQAHGPNSARECPHCWEPMRRDGSVCPHCGRESTPWSWRSGRWWAFDPTGRELVLDEATWEWLEPEAAAARDAAARLRLDILVTDTGPDPDDVARTLGRVMNFSIPMASRLLRNVPAPVASRVPGDRAEAIRAALEAAGASVALSASPTAETTSRV
jgi:hypothetical protein